MENIKFGMESYFPNHSMPKKCHLGPQNSYKSLGPKWDTKVYSHSFKEEFSSGFCCDILLAGYHYGHLWESVKYHKHTVVAVLSRKKARHVIHGDGFLRSTRGRKRSIEAFLLDGWRNQCIIRCTSRFPVEGSANRNTSAVLPLFSRPRNAQWPDCSALPISSWHARLKEQKGVPCDIVAHPGGEILELGFPPRVSGMCG